MPNRDDGIIEEQHPPLVPPKLLTPEQFLALSPNKRLLAVKEQIEFSPEHWDQGPVVHVGGQGSTGWCNTTFCTAGWALFLAGAIRMSDTIPYVPCWDARASELLGLKENSDQDKLFYVDKAEWPALIDRILAENAD